MAVFWNKATEFRKWVIFPSSGGKHTKRFLLATCLHAGFLLAYFSTLKMEAICSSQTSVDFQQTTRRYIPEDGTLPTQITLMFVGSEPLSAVAKNNRLLSSGVWHPYRLVGVPRRLLGTYCFHVQSKMISQASSGLNLLNKSSTLKMDAIRSFETSVNFYCGVASYEIVLFIFHLIPFHYLAHRMPLCGAGLPCLIFERFRVRISAKRPTDVSQDIMSCHIISRLITEWYLKVSHDFLFQSYAVFKYISSIQTDFSKELALNVQVIPATSVSLHQYVTLCDPT
jgi:hypothetical protein